MQTLEHRLRVNGNKACHSKNCQNSGEILFCLLSSWLHARTHTCKVWFRFALQAPFPVTGQLQGVRRSRPQSLQTLSSFYRSLRRLRSHRCIGICNMHRIHGRFFSPNMKSDLRSSCGAQLELCQALTVAGLIVQIRRKIAPRGAARVWWSIYSTPTILY